MSNVVKVILLLVMSIVLVGNNVHAQTEPPIQNTGTANCDICGYCGGTNPEPSDWKSCVRCVYPEVYDQIYKNNPSAPASIGETLKETIVPDADQHYTVIGCISTKPGAFVGGLSQFIFRIIGGIGFLFLLYGAFILATSRGDYEKLNQGKKIVFSSIAGLLFVLFATFIIRFVAVNILKIPGFS